MLVHFILLVQQDCKKDQTKNILLKMEDDHIKKY